ncbi:hypothetical protein F01_400071 [Burkholderia cenocepacia]|nr:hypothetical protein F01_400071 [Burkholderia cenocepacia]
MIRLPISSARSRVMCTIIRISPQSIDDLNCIRHELGALTSTVNPIGAPKAALDTL